MEILLIEDDEAVREFISEVLLGAGYFVSVAGNGKDGLDEIKRDPDIAMVITDIVMPEKEGIETIIEIKQSLRSRLSPYPAAAESAPKIICILQASLEPTSL